MYMLSRSRSICANHLFMQWCLCRFCYKNIICSLPSHFFAAVGINSTVSSSQPQWSILQTLQLSLKSASVTMATSSTQTPQFSRPPHSLATHSMMARTITTCRGWTRSHVWLLRASGRTAPIVLSPWTSCSVWRIGWYVHKILYELISHKCVYVLCVCAAKLCC